MPHTSPGWNRLPLPSRSHPWANGPQNFSLFSACGRPARSGRRGEGERRNHQEFLPGFTQPWTYCHAFGQALIYTSDRKCAFNPRNPLDFEKAHVWPDPKGPAQGTGKIPPPRPKMKVSPGTTHALSCPAGRRRSARPLPADPRRSSLAGTSPVSSCLRC